MYKQQNGEYNLQIDYKKRTLRTIYSYHVFAQNVNPNGNSIYSHLFVMLIE